VTAVRPAPRPRASHQSQAAELVYIRSLDLDLRWLALAAKRKPLARSTMAEAAAAVKPLVKICGTQDPDSAVIAAKAGADFIGMIFVPKSKCGEHASPLSSLLPLRLLRHTTADTDRCRRFAGAA
jgi:hypothetical protein